MKKILICWILERKRIRGPWMAPQVEAFLTGRTTHGDSKFAKEYLSIADLMEMHFQEETGRMIERRR